MFTRNYKKQPPEIFYKKAAIKNFSIITGKSSYGPSDLQLYQKEIPAKVFFCEYCKIFKYAYFEENL